MMCSGRLHILEMIKRTPASYGVQNIMQCLDLDFGMKVRHEEFTWHESMPWNSFVLTFNGTRLGVI